VRFRPWLVRLTGIAKPRDARDASLLGTYLVDLDRRGWDLDAFVKERPDMSASLQAMLRSADQVRHASNPVASEAFQSRSRERLWAAMARPGPRRRLALVGPHWRYPRPLIAPVAAGLLVVLGLGGVWSASAEALPNTPLYSAKLIFEQAQLITAVSPDRRAEVHLEIAQARLREAQLESKSGNVTTAEELIRGSEIEVARAKEDYQGQSPPTAFATAVASQVAQVDSERRVVATRVVSLAPTDTPSMESPDDHLSPTAVAGDDLEIAQVGKPSRVPTVQQFTPTWSPTPAAVEHPQGHPSPGRGGSHRDEIPATSTPLMTPTWTAVVIHPTATGIPTPIHAPVVMPTAVPPTAVPPEPTNTVTPTTSQNADQLLHLLVSQALSDDPATQATARQYINLVNSSTLSGPTTQELVAQHRAILERAIASAPEKTRPILEFVLAALNHSEGSFLTETARSVTPSPTPTRARPLSPTSTPTGTRHDAATSTPTPAPPTATPVPQVTRIRATTATPTARPNAKRQPTPTITPTPTRPTLPIGRRLRVRASTRLAGSHSMPVNQVA